MGHIPEESIQLVLDQTDIVDLINSYVPLKRAGSLFKANCPFHNEKTPSFTVNPGMQRYKCFGCDAGGNAIGFVMQYENLPFPEAVRKLAQRAGVPIIEAAEDPQAAQQRRTKSRLLELHNKAARHMHDLLVHAPDAKHARAYLRGRGYGKEMAERWLVGWMPDTPRAFLAWAKEHGFTGRELCASGLASLKEENNPRAGLYLRFRDRLMFPIHNDYGDIIAFSGRQLREDPRSGKYINSPETALFKKAKVFFALDKARRPISKEKFALICEGQIDVIACHEAGIDNAVAPLGTAFTPEHAKLLKRFTDTVVLCFDSDSAGHKALGRAFEHLAPAGLEVRVVTLPEKEDPDSLIKSQGPDSFRQLLSNASDFFDAEIEFAQRHGLLSHPQKRARIAIELAAKLKKIPNAVTRDSLINHVATRLQLGLTEFRDTISKVREQRNYRSDEDQQPQLNSRSVDPAILLLCQLGLQSAEVLDWLCDQTETLLEHAFPLPGGDLLSKLLGNRPIPPASPPSTRSSPPSNPPTNASSPTPSNNPSPPTP